MVALLLTAVLALQGQTLTFSGPDKAKPEDLKKAAAALEARCKAYGYEGITCAVKKGAVELTSQTEITSKVLRTITQLAELNAGKITILLSRRTTTAEDEQYSGPKTDADVKAPAPKGMRWFKVNDFTNPRAVGPWHPVYERGELKGAQIASVAVENDQIVVKLSDTAKDIVAEYMKGGQCTAYLVAQNGLTITYRGAAVGDGSTIKADADNVETSVVAHQMPFPLTLK